MTDRVNMTHKTGNNRWLRLWAAIAGTFLCMIFYRLLQLIPIPFLDISKVAEFTTSDNDFLRTLASGGAESYSIAALGIRPYIVVSLFLNVFGLVIPSLSELYRRGSLGRNKIRTITSFLAAVFAAVSGFVVCRGYFTVGLFKSFWEALAGFSGLFIGSIAVIALIYIVDRYLFGNGISAFIFVNLLSELKQLFYGSVFGQTVSPAIRACVYAGLLIFVVCAYLCYKHGKDVDVTYDVNHAVGGERRTEPLRFKMFSNGLLPVMFAGMFMPLLRTGVVVLFGEQCGIADLFDMSQWFSLRNVWANTGILIYAFGIYLFNKYYRFINANPHMVADDLLRKGCVVNGVNPGRDTERFLKKIFFGLDVRYVISLLTFVLVFVAAANIFGLTAIRYVGISLLFAICIVCDWFDEYRSYCFKRYADRPAACDSVFVKKAGRSFVRTLSGRSFVYSVAVCVKISAFIAAGVIIFSLL